MHCFFKHFFIPPFFLNNSYQKFNGKNLVAIIIKTSTPFDNFYSNYFENYSLMFTLVKNNF